MGQTAIMISSGAPLLMAILPTLAQGLQLAAEHITSLFPLGPTSRERSKSLEALSIIHYYYDVPESFLHKE